MYTVLIVDDISFMRLMIRKLLTKSGYRVIGEADSREEAVKFYKKLRPDLVIMDICMPEEADTAAVSSRNSGVQAIKEIIAIEPEAIIIVCSALGYKDMVLDAMQAGAKHYLTKPFQHKELLAVIRKYLAED